MTEFNRRTFLKGVGLAAVSAALPLPTFSKKKNKEGKIKFPNLKFNANGKFRIMHITDTHVISGDNRSERAVKNVIEMIETEKPDLIIHTGDMIFGGNAKDSLNEILGPICEHKIPWAVALGNHDGQFGMSRKEVFDYVRSLPYNINTPQKPGVDGDSNDIITISSSDGTQQWILYLLDTHDRYKTEYVDSWGTLMPSQVEWYRRESNRLKEANDGKTLPALAFMHIPLFEHRTAFADKNKKLIGNKKEDICSPDVNTGMFMAMTFQEDVKAMLCGHDHDNDYVMKWHGKYLIYGRFSGCDTVYNNLKPNGCRMVELNVNSENFRTYIRLQGGKVEQDLNLPNDL